MNECGEKESRLPFPAPQMTPCPKCPVWSPSEPWWGDVCSFLPLLLCLVSAKSSTQPHNQNPCFHPCSQGFGLEVPTALSIPLHYQNPQSPFILFFVFSAPWPWSEIGQLPGKDSLWGPSPWVWVPYIWLVDLHLTRRNKDTERLANLPEASNTEARFKSKLLAPQPHIVFPQSPLDTLWQYAYTHTQSHRHLDPHSNPPHSTTQERKAGGQTSVTNRSLLKMRRGQ